MRGPIPDKPQTRPTVPEVMRVVADYYRKPGNGVGGSLHIVLDDQNLDDDSIAYCRECALERNDPDGVALADMLLALTRTQRKRVTYWYDYTPDDYRTD